MSDKKLIEKIFNDYVEEEKIPDYIADMDSMYKAFMREVGLQPKHSIKADDFTGIFEQDIKNDNQSQKNEKNKNYQRPKSFSQKEQESKEQELTTEDVVKGIKAIITSPQAVFTRINISYKGEEEIVSLSSEDELEDIAQVIINRIVNAAYKQFGKLFKDKIDNIDMSQYTQKQQKRIQNKLAKSKQKSAQEAELKNINEFLTYISKKDIFQINIMLNKNQFNVQFDKFIKKPETVKKIKNPKLFLEALKRVLEDENERDVLYGYMLDMFIKPLWSEVIKQTKKILNTKILDKGSKNLDEENKIKQFEESAYFEIAFDLNSIDKVFNKELSAATRLLKKNRKIEIENNAKELEPESKNISDKKEDENKEDENEEDKNEEDEELDEMKKEDRAIVQALDLAHKFLNTSDGLKLDRIFKKYHTEYGSAKKRKEDGEDNYVYKATAVSLLIAEIMASAIPFLKGKRAKINDGIVDERDSEEVLEESELFFNREQTYQEGVISAIRQFIQVKSPKKLAKRSTKRFVKFVNSMFQSFKKRKKFQESVKEFYTNNGINYNRMVKIILEVKRDNLIQKDLVTDEQVKEYASIYGKRLIKVFEEDLQEIFADRDKKLEYMAFDFGADMASKIDPRNVTASVPDK